MSEYNPTQAPQTISEVWRDVPGYESFYQVSDRGRVRSLARTVPLRGRNGTMTTRPVRERVLTVRVRAGYMQVGLHRDGQGGKWVLVHSLVAQAFLGPRPDRHNIHHINGNQRDNSALNLEYMPTRDHQRMHKIGNVNNAKLTESDVRTIRDLLKSGELTHKNIAKRYGVARVTISAIGSRRNWSHVT